MEPKVYFRSDDILIRDMLDSDAEAIAAEERAQGWNQSADKYYERLRHREQGKAVPLVAEYKGSIAGYISVYPDSEWGAFGGMGYPEIVDFGVLEKFRRLGIGSSLMDVAEQIALQYADMVYLGVGLHRGYGSAQRMYIKRGYIPDGSGVWYRDKVCPPYDTGCANDDDLLLYLSKELCRNSHDKSDALDSAK